MVAIQRDPSHCTSAVNDICGLTPSHVSHKIKKEERYLIRIHFFIIFTLFFKLAPDFPKLRVVYTLFIDVINRLN